MKIILLIIGSLAGLYTLFAVVQLLRNFLASDPGTAYGTMNIAASVVPVCIGLIVCLACFMSVFRKPKA